MFVGDLESPDGAFDREGALGALEVFFDGFLTFADAGIDGILWHDVAVFQQEISELGGRFPLLGFFDGEVEEDNDPHVTEVAFHGGSGLGVEGGEFEKIGVFFG